MNDLESELETARAMDVDELADAIETIGFSCTRCGACCRGHGDAHTATVFPDEVRSIAGDEYDWRDVARPMPFGLEGDDEGDAEGETFEWALQTGSCGDCTFYEDGEEEGPGVCTVYDDRPLICETYPFSVEIGGTEPMGQAVQRVGQVRAHECEGLGQEIERSEALSIARTLKTRAIRETEEMIAVRDRYEPIRSGPGEVVVHDSEGAKRPDGSTLQ